MAITNHERVGKGLDLLKSGLQPFVLRELQAAYGEKWKEEVKEVLSGPPARRPSKRPTSPEMDCAALLKVIWDCWNDVFGKTLGYAERSLVSELRDTRHKWAHQENFTTDDA